jgi:hypothetical protein
MTFADDGTDHPAEKKLIVPISLPILVRMALMLSEQWIL